MGDLIELSERIRRPPPTKTERAIERRARLQRIGRQARLLQRLITKVDLGEQVAVRRRLQRLEVDPEIGDLLALVRAHANAWGP